MSDQTPASGEIRLVVSCGKYRGNVVLLPPKIVLIGRSRECHLRLGSGLVDPRHCALAPHGRTLSVWDLATRNGTYVNGGRIGRQARLKDGDELVVGPVPFRVCVPATLSWKEPLDRQRREIAWLWDDAENHSWKHLDRLGETPPDRTGSFSHTASACIQRNGDQIAIAAGQLWTAALGNGRNGND